MCLLQNNTTDWHKELVVQCNLQSNSIVKVHNEESLFGFTGLLCKINKAYHKKEKFILLLRFRLCFDTVEFFFLSQLV